MKSQPNSWTTVWILSTQQNLDLQRLYFFLQITPLIFVHTPSVFHTCHMSYLSHYSGFNQINNIWWAVQFMNLFLMQSLPVPCYLVPFRRKYLSQHPILPHPQPIFLPECDTPIFTPISNKRHNYVSAYFDIHISWTQIARNDSRNSLISSIT